MPAPDGRNSAGASRPDPAEGSSRRDTAADYLSGLNPEQQAAVLHSKGPLLILAGAGSGKTRVITTKIAYLIREMGVNPESILAVTFTNKAAKEMAERASRLDPRASRATIRTFHSFGAWLLRRNAQAAGLPSSFTIYDDSDTLSLLSAVNQDMTRTQLSPFSRWISRAKDYCLGPDSPELNRITSEDSFPAIYKAYQERLTKAGAVDFGDLITRCVKLMRDEPGVRARIRQRFSVVMVDEYQDSNVAQYEFLRELCGPETYICVVGDDDQSIYRFRGAEVKNILTFDERFPGTTVIRLERNYRSTQNILSIATAVVENNSGRLGKTLIAQRPGGGKATIAYLHDQDQEAAYCARVVAEHRKSGGRYGDVAILYRTNAQSLEFETAFLRLGIPYQVVGSLKFYEREEVKDTLSWLSFLTNPLDEVSFRRIINKPVRGIGEKSIERIVASAVRLAAGGETEPFLIACEEAGGMREGEALASKGAAGARSFVALAKTLKILLGPEVPEASASPETPEPEVAGIASTAAEAARVSTTPDPRTVEIAVEAGAPVKPGKGNGKKSRRREPEGLAAFVQRVIMDTGLADYHKGQDEIQGSQKVQNLEQLINGASSYPADRAGLSSFLESIALDRSLAIEGEELDGVVLITIHNTKGLEFPVVVVSGMEAGLFPREEEEGEEREEERRLFYVAITRAKDALFFTTCRERRLWGRLEEMYPSPFLAEIPRDLVETVGSYGGAEEAVGGGEWAAGTAVFSEEYGSGVICRRWHAADQLMVEVEFESGRRAKLFPKYNKLERISRDGF
jgi:DNA helicase II / ATP-dependent DNA helicase PcrA